MQPHQYPKRILLAVTGLSPQIVTETLYALTQTQQPPFIPTEIHLITTAEGAAHARLNLLSGDPGWFHQLRRDYDLPAMRFDDSTLHIVTDADGQPLNDIRSPQDNERVADCIADIVRGLTAERDTAVHVSLAGGRKTMGYYLGYALSLYGRSQDRLSHILVSAPFESHPEFYYPTRAQRVIQTREAKPRPLDCRDAVVELAEIPFVRLRDGLPRELLEGRAHFSDAVREAQKALSPLSLVLDPENRAVRAGGERFTLKPAEFSFYWVLAERAQRGLPGLHWSEPALVDELLAVYAKLVNPYSGDYEKTEKIYRKDYSKENFDPAKSHVNQAIKRALGEGRAQFYLIDKRERIDRTRYWRSGLNLPADAITIQPASLPEQTKHAHHRHNHPHKEMR